MRGWPRLRGTACASPAGCARWVEFAITNGVMVPAHGPMIQKVLTDNLASCSVGPQCVGDEPRFAAAIYRAALDDGIMHRVAFN